MYLRKSTGKKSVAIRQILERIIQVKAYGALQSLGNMSFFTFQLNTCLN